MLRPNIHPPMPNADFRFQISNYFRCFYDNRNLEKCKKIEIDIIQDKFVYIEAENGDFKTLKV